MIFATDRGTPIGALVPTIKVSTNNELTTKNGRWIDINVGRLLGEISMDDSAKEFLNDILKITAEKRKSRMNSMGIAIFKNGVTL